MMADNIDTDSKTDLELFRARQKARNRALGFVLLGLVALFFAITIVKMSLHSTGQM